MPQTGDEIVNPRTRQRTVFVQTAEDTAGELLRLESFHAGGSPAEPEHVHPFQESRCRVVAGSLRFSVAGEEQDLLPGQEIVIPANTPHFFWNAGAEEAHAVQEFRPALTIAEFFEDYFALAREGKLGRGGLPRNPLRLAAMMQAYDRDIRPTKPPRIVQQVFSTLLGPLGRLLGYGSMGGKAS